MPKRRGRPPLDANDPSVPVQVRMPGREYDSVYERARRERVSVPEICRRALARSRREDDQED
ncbi:MAG: hypothetical protein ACRD1U_06760 [Vicinamibacterales bacterium]